jgi:hypothetical protein
MEDLLAAYGLTNKPEEEKPEQIPSIFAKYFDNDYERKALEAKKKRDELIAAYKGSLASAAQVKTNEPSQAERYFRLAQALLDPGQSGNFYESMGNVSRVSAEFEKEKRLARQQQEMKAIEAATTGQQLDIEAAASDVDFYSKLAEKGVATQGDIAKKLIEQSMKPKEAQSSAGKQAMDEGLTPGTPEFHKRVAAIASQSGDAAEARLNMALASASLAQTKFERSQMEFSTFEQKALGDESDALFARQEAVGMLSEALSLNDLAYDSSPADVIAYNTALISSPGSPKVVATNELNNILKTQMLTVLKSTFGAAPTEGERAVLEQVQGIDAKSKTERRRIIERAIRLAEARIKQSQSKIGDIQSGKFRFRTGAEQ